MPVRLVLVLLTVVMLWGSPFASPAVAMSPSEGAHALESELLFLHDHVRNQHGVGMLDGWTDLRDRARSWSRHLAQGDGSLSHNTSTDDVCCWKDFAENVGRFPMSDLSVAEVRRVADDAMRSWMASPGHRDNVLRPGWEHMGIGVSLRSGDCQPACHQAFVTVNFRTPNGQANPASVHHRAGTGSRLAEPKPKPKPEPEPSPVPDPPPAATPQPQAARPPATSTAAPEPVTPDPTAGPSVTVAEPEPQAMPSPEPHGASPGGDEVDEGPAEDAPTLLSGPAAAPNDGHGDALTHQVLAAGPYEVTPQQASFLGVGLLVLLAVAQRRFRRTRRAGKP